MPNLVGLIGMIAVILATIGSPTGFLVVTLFVLVPLGFGGLALSFVGCFFKPRWYGIVGVTVGLLCLLFWGGLYFGVMWYGNAQAGKRGLTMGQWAQTSMSCTGLVWHVEAARTPAGAPPATFDVTTVPDDCKDPWGRLYRYTLTPVTAANPYGYTFMSDGPDGIAETTDDLDLISIHPADGTFGLPTPPKPPPGPVPVPAPAPATPKPAG
jgi:hypothetical protein